MTQLVTRSLLSFLMTLYSTSMTLRGGAWLRFSVIVPVSRLSLYPSFLFDLSSTICAFRAVGVFLKSFSARGPGLSPTVAWGHLRLESTKLSLFALLCTFYKKFILNLYLEMHVVTCVFDLNGMC